MREAVLVSNGPGELYTWVRPVLDEIERRTLDLKTTISLIPCQFATGNEAGIARTFGADGVTTPSEFLHYMATGRRPAALGGDDGFVLSLGGNLDFAIRLGRKLGYPVYRYGFVPAWSRRLRLLFVHDASSERKARRQGAPRDRVRRVGNLVADVVQASEPIEDRGDPHVLLFPGSRDTFAVALIPLFLALAEALGERFPHARFVWPVSRLLKDSTLSDGIAARQAVFPGSVAGRREGSAVSTPTGVTVELIPEADRYRHMRSADLAVTIPGTNTLELGIAGVPSVVLLPMNRPEAIPLEGMGHWLGLIPLIGKPLKRRAVKLFVDRLTLPISLPNRISGEDLMVEIRGRLGPDEVVAQTAALLDDPADRSRRRTRLLETMPKPGAATQLVAAILDDVG